MSPSSSGPKPPPKGKAKGIPTGEAADAPRTTPVAPKRRPVSAPAGSKDGASPKSSSTKGSAKITSPKAVPAKAATKRKPNLDPDELAALEEQRSFLLRSLADLDREHDAGDLADDDYETLKDDYTARAADVIRAIEDQHAAFADARPPRSLGRTMAVVAGVALFAIVAGLMVAKTMGARKAGESASGGITVQQTSTQKANACVDKMQTDAEAASACFEKALKEDPENVVALTWSAWQLSLSANNFPEGQKQAAQALAAIRLDEAVKADPAYSFARAFRAVVAYRNGRYADAKQYLAEFRANDPSSTAAQVIAAEDLDAKIAAGLAGTASTTTPDAGTPGAATTTAPN